MSANLVSRDLVESWFREEWGGWGAYPACRQLGQLNEICWSTFDIVHTAADTSHSSKLSHASTRISRPKKANTLMIGGSNSPQPYPPCQVAVCRGGIGAMATSWHSTRGENGSGKCWAVSGCERWVPSSGVMRPGHTAGGGGARHQQFGSQ